MSILDPSNPVINLMNMINHIAYSLTPGLAPVNEIQRRLWYNAAMVRKRPSPLLRGLLVGSILAAAAILPRIRMLQRYAGEIFNLESAPPAPFTIVLGAGLRRDGRPTRVLADRIRTAAALYRDGRTERLIMSGTLRPPEYDEPAAMRDLAIDLGVPEDAILLDGGGVRTYQSCLRAKEIFGVEHTLLVSQRFHLPRALLLCDAVGLRAAGVIADFNAYRVYWTWELREIPATLRACWDAYRHNRSRAQASQLSIG
jgi:SanA protein